MGGGAKLRVRIGSRRSSTPSAAWRRKNTRGLSRGFGHVSKRAGMNRWIETPLLGSWICSLKRPKINPRGGFFASGHRRSELCRDSPFLGSVPRTAPGHSKGGGQELPSVAARPSSPFAAFPSAAGQRGVARGGKGDRNPEAPGCIISGGPEAKMAPGWRFGKVYAQSGR